MNADTANNTPQAKTRRSVFGLSVSVKRFSTANFPAVLRHGRSRALPKTGLRPPLERSRGFTLVEMVVAVGLFTAVVLIGISVLLTVGDASKRAHAQRAVIDNLNLAIENISRTMRVGRDFHCDASAGTITVPRNCAGGAESIAFETAIGAESLEDLRGLCFSLDSIGGRILRGDIESGSCRNEIPITSEEIVVEDLRFVVVGAERGDDLQPRIFMVVKGVVETKTGQEDFNLQTTITQREYQAGG